MSKKIIDWDELKAEMLSQPDVIQNGDQYYTGKSGYADALCTGLRGKTSTDFTVLKLPGLMQNAGERAG